MTIPSSGSGPSNIRPYQSNEGLPPVQNLKAQLTGKLIVNANKTDEAANPVMNVQAGSPSSIKGSTTKSDIHNAGGYLGTVVKEIGRAITNFFDGFFNKIITLFKKNEKPVNVNFKPSAEQSRPSPSAQPSASPRLEQNTRVEAPKQEPTSVPEKMDIQAALKEFYRSPDIKGKELFELEGERELQKQFLEVGQKAIQQENQYQGAIKKEGNLREQVGGSERIVPRKVIIAEKMKQANIENLQSLVSLFLTDERKILQNYIKTLSEYVNTDEEKAALAEITKEEENIGGTIENSDARFEKEKELFDRKSQIMEKRREKIAEVIKESDQAGDLLALSPLRSTPQRNGLSRAEVEQYRNQTIELLINHYSEIFENPT